MVTEARLPLPSIVGMAVVILSATLGLLWPTCEHDGASAQTGAASTPVVVSSAVSRDAQALDTHGAEVVPVYEGEGERLVGFRVLDIEAGSLFAEMGLDTGDVLTRVDVSSVEGVRIVDVELLRDGKPLEARYRHVEPVVHERRVLDVGAEALMAEALRPGSRLVPAFEGGAPIGIQLFAVSEDSLFAAAGLSNGDVVRRVNGHAIDGPDTALAAYERLKGACVFRLDLLRNGAPLAIEVTVPDLCGAPRDDVRDDGARDDDARDDARVDSP